MASKQPRLKVIITPAAKRDLFKIWLWNAENRGASHADSYQGFLESQIAKLATDYLLGRRIPVAPEFFNVIARKSTRGHGHSVIYQIYEDRVEILRLFHTSQDWQERFMDGK